MFFRIYFLYLCKVANFGLVLLIISFVLPVHLRLGDLVRTAGLALVIPICIAGALSALVVLAGKRLACPLCGESGEFVVDGKKPALECDRCGLVSCKNIWLSFKLNQEPFEDLSGDES